MMKRLLAVALTTIVLAACASPKYVVSDVTRYHTLPATPSGQNFVIATIDADQGQSLAYRQYADMVTAKLVSMGLKPFSGPTESADLVVTLRYGVRGPTPDIESRYGSNFSLGVGGGGWGHHGGWGGWGAWNGPYDNDIDTRQLYVREVELNIYRGASYTSPNKVRVFEGRALSAGQNGQLEPVMPYILDAMFKDFPGRSGETQQVDQVEPLHLLKFSCDAIYAGPLKARRSSFAITDGIPGHWRAGGHVDQHRPLFGLVGRHVETFLGREDFKRDAAFGTGGVRSINFVLRRAHDVAGFQHLVAHMQAAAHDDLKAFARMPVTDNHRARLHLQGQYRRSVLVVGIAHHKG